MRIKERENVLVSTIIFTYAFNAMKEINNRFNPKEQLAKLRVRPANRDKQDPDGEEEDKDSDEDENEQDRTHSK